jgi:hypothetical protein
MKLVHLIGAICLTCSGGGWILAQDSNPPGSSSTNPGAHPHCCRKIALRQGPEHSG